MTAILSEEQQLKLQTKLDQMGIKNFHINMDGELSDDELDSIIETFTKLHNIKLAKIL